MKEFLTSIWKVISCDSGLNFITTMFGVFAGYLLSSWQYNSQKSKEQKEQELVYYKILSKEIFTNKETILHIKNKYLSQIDSLKELQGNELHNRATSILISIGNVFETNTSDFSFSIIIQNGIVKLLDDKIIKNYRGLKWLKLIIEPIVANIHDGKRRIDPKSYIDDLEHILDSCTKLEKTFEEVIPLLDKYEEN